MKKGQQPRPAASRPTGNSYGQALLQVLSRRIGRGSHVTNRELADALELSAGLPLPVPVLAYLCDRLRATEPIRRGRKPGGIVAELRNRFAFIRYGEVLAEMRAAEKKNPRKRLRSDPSLSELAAEKVAAELYPAASGPTVRNAITKLRTGKP